MGASVRGYWVGIGDEQRANMPGFWNDCQAFGAWMAAIQQRPDVLKIIGGVGCGPILTVTTNGVADSDVDWIAPEELKAAALRLQERVLAEDPGLKAVLDIYADGAELTTTYHEQFARDLSDVAEIAAYAAHLGVTAMTLAVTW